jgi:hypothetical protein
MEICAKYAPVTIGCDQYGLENLREQMTERGERGQSSNREAKPYDLRQF